MTTEELLTLCQTSIEANGCLVLDDDTFRLIDPDQVGAVRSRYGSKYLLRLPSHEISFFEWLRTADEVVWKDLWEGGEAPYLVSMAYLKDFSGANANGTFVICDLVSTDNYYFSPDLIIEKESDDYIAAVRERFRDRQSLTPAQLLALEASNGPIDIWHFAHRYNLSLETAKRAVQELVDDRILLHVPSAEHLANYFDVH